MVRPILSFETKLDKRVDKSAGPDNCWPWTGFVSPAGYATMTHGRDKYIGVHRVAFFVHNGYWPKIVMHTCDYPCCCNPKHLKGGTQKENIADMFRKGRQSKNLNHTNRHRGSDNVTAKLNEDIVKEILISNLSQRKLAAKYNVSPRCILFVRQRKTWRHVT